MEEKEIGIDREIAICFQIRKKKNTLRLEPIKVIEGFYNKTEDCFYDQLGHEYCHISYCDSITFDRFVFGGKIAIPNNLKELGIDLEKYKEAYEIFTELGDYEEVSEIDVTGSVVESNFRLTEGISKVLSVTIGMLQQNQEDKMLKFATSVATEFKENDKDHCQYCQYTNICRG